ncbi:MAG: hypothetical protein V4617_08225 [Gemmatimonadota bacterium]
MHFLRRDAARTASAVLLASFLAACGEATVTAPAPDALFVPPDVTAHLDVTPAVNDVIIRVGDPGEFTNPITPTNALRITGAFWDNLSADNNASTINCNIGFYAVGTISPLCSTESPGTYQNRGGYDRYFGDGPADRDAAGFRFSGDYIYTVEFLGSYAGAVSEVGWYTISPSGTYQFNPVADWGAGNVTGASVTINTGGLDWGFYITNAFAAWEGGCRVNTYCTDATGGFTSAPKQQFSLMLNSANSTYLVGIEDNRLDLLPNQFTRDSDYQDYIFSVVPNAIPEVCDFMTFGRLVTEVNGQKVVISGNAGGNAPDGGILTEFHVEVNGRDYHVSDISSYGAIANGALAGLPNARVWTGTARTGETVQLRLWDGGEPGADADRAYVSVNGTAYLGALGAEIDQGNVQYHATCRGPKR